MIISRWKAITFIVIIGIFYNNILRWLPFSPGTSLNDSITLADNITGIVFNFFLYALLISLLWSRRPRFGNVFKHSRLLYGYCLYILIQSFFRPDITMEIARGIAIIVMFLSADWLGKYFGNDIRLLSRVMPMLWKSMVGVLFIGIAIALVLPGSVNWGGGLSPSFVQQDRSEFFFFYLSPAITFALSIVMIKGQHSKVIHSLAVVSALVIVALAVGTQGRGLLFSLSLITLIFLYKYYKRCLIVMLVIVSLLTFGRSEVVRESLQSGRFISETPGEDLSSGRLLLNIIILEAFTEAPIFGQGAVQVRQIIWDADSLAKTEHGYVMHLGSYGSFAVLFYIYILYGLKASIQMIFRKPIGFASYREIQPLLLVQASLALTWFFLGFVGVFGSGSSFYDWFAIFTISLSFSLYENTCSSRALEKRELSALLNYKEIMQ